jgi:hypothetical protein
MRTLMAGLVLLVVLGTASQAQAHEFKPSWGYAFVDDRPFNEPAGGALLPATEVFPRGMIRDTVVDQKDVRMIVRAYAAGNNNPVSSYHVNEGDFVDKAFDRRLDVRPNEVSHIQYQFCRITPPDGANEVCEPVLQIGRPPPVPVPPVDLDGDGVSPPADCADNNATVWPGAREIPGNQLDDDCVNGDAPGKVLAPVKSAWRLTRRGVRVKHLRVREAPPGARVAIRCINRRCRFRARTVRATPAGGANLGRFFKRPVRYGTVLEVRITAPNMIGKVVRYKMRRGVIPSGRTLCLPPGAAKPGKC